MKRKILGFTILLICILLFASGLYVFNDIFPKAANIRIPEIHNIISISMAVNTDDSFKVEDANLEELLEEIRKAEPTRKQSLDDYPSTRPFYEVEVKASNREYRYLIYEEGAQVYVEMPYEGIYTADIIEE